MLKKMADKNGQALGRFCANILLEQHCGNCKRMLRHKDPNQLAVNLKKELDASLKENERIKADLASLQHTLEKFQKNNEDLEDQLDMANKFIEDLQQGKDTKTDLDEAQEKLNEQITQNKTLASRNDMLVSGVERLKQENLNKQDTIQHLEHEKNTIQNQLVEWQRWYDIIIGKDAGKIQKLATEVEVNQAQILRDLIEFGLSHSQDIYIEDLEAK
jgi:lysyl-tRNA synthetase class I